LDNPRLTSQLCSLECRTARSGKLSIDSAPGAHEDVANAVAGALVLAANKPGALVIPAAAQARMARPLRSTPVFF
jgi:hypothetical protein